MYRTCTRAPHPTKETQWCTFCTCIQCKILCVHNTRISDTARAMMSELFTLPDPSVPVKTDTDSNHPVHVGRFFLISDNHNKHFPWLGQNIYCLCDDILQRIMRQTTLTIIMAISSLSNVLSAEHDLFQPERNTLPSCGVGERSGKVMISVSVHVAHLAPPNMDSKHRESPEIGQFKQAGLFSAHLPVGPTDS